MDKLIEIFTSFKERLRNPFFSSYIIAWLVTNWRLTLDFIFITDQQLKVLGLNSYSDLVSYHLNENGYWYSFSLPLLYAFLYHIIISVANIGIAGIKTLAVTWTDSIEIKITKGANIPILKFLNLKSEYDKRTKILEEIIKDENKTNEAFEAEKTSRLEALANLEKIRNQYSEQLSIAQKDAEAARKTLNDTFDTSFLDGTWLVKIDNTQIPFDFRSNQIYNKLTNTAEYSYSNFFYNKSSKRLFFIKYPIPVNYDTSKTNPKVKHPVICEFDVISKDFLKGIEYPDVHVQFQRT